MYAHVYYLNWDDNVDLREEASQLQAQIRHEDKYPDADVVEGDEYRYIGMWNKIDEIGDVWDLLDRNPEGYDHRLDELEERSICVGASLSSDRAMEARHILSSR